MAPIGLIRRTPFRLGSSRASTTQAETIGSVTSIGLWSDGPNRKLLILSQSLVVPTKLLARSVLLRKDSFVFATLTMAILGGVEWLSGVTGLMEKRNILVSKNYGVHEFVLFPCYTCLMPRLSFTSPPFFAYYSCTVKLNDNEEISTLERKDLCHEIGHCLGLGKDFAALSTHISYSLLLRLSHASSLFYSTTFSHL